MTASTPPLVDVIAGVVVAHWAKTISAEGDGFWIQCRCGAIGEVESDAEDWEPANKWIAAHQARAVLDALEKAGGVEWAIQMPTFIDGDFDRTYAKDALTGKPFTEDAAKHHSWLDSRSPIPARVVSRLTLPWTAVEG